MADTAPHPDSLAAWAERVCSDDSISETGPVKPRARQVMDLAESLAAEDAALARRQDELRDQIGDLERELGNVSAERGILAATIHKLRAAPAEPLAKATRRRKEEGVGNTEAPPEPVAEAAE